MKVIPVKSLLLLENSTECDAIVQPKEVFYLRPNLKWCFKYPKRRKLSKSFLLLK